MAKKKADGARSSRSGRGARSGGHEREEPAFRSPLEIVGAPPKTFDALHEWLARELGIYIARRAIVHGHQAPFDYLCHAFFEGCVPGETAPAQAADCVVWANRGGGKTWLGALATLLDLLFKPGIQVRILGGSLDQSLRMRAWLCAFLAHERLAEIAYRIEAKRIIVYHDPERRVRSVVEVLAASQTSVRGTRVQKLRCDEVDLFDREVWEAAQLVTRSMPCEGPWGSTVRGSVEALSTMHRPFGLMWNLVGPRGAAAGPVEVSPRPVFRWGVLDVLEFCTDEHVCETCILHPECQGRAKTERSPGTGGHISVADAVDQKVRVAKETWESEMLCLRPSRADTVYPGFDAATHVVGDRTPGDPPFERFIGGMDFGFRSEAALLLAGVEADGTVVVLREHVRRGVVLGDFITRLERWLDEGVGDRGRFEFLGVDPAGGARSDQTGRSNIQVIKARGFTAKAKGSDIHDGVLLVQGRLRPPAIPGVVAERPRLLIHQSCTRLIECMTRYRYNPDREDDLNPMKEGHDHAPDALRYMILHLDAPDQLTISEY